ncbi:uncharacterized protein LOC111615292 [Centruroides sculpturatus]|uniref:uncharacterized protein LOC111615292 n=1 Tax=Centruroides sculpturatus TaxID=218467 RepID=UPI000C6CEFA9|nr:uncharacterized protein LOC111615292 [Centruroides sculpturatus]
MVVLKILIFFFSFVNVCYLSPVPTDIKLNDSEKLSIKLSKPNEKNETDTTEQYIEEILDCVKAPEYSYTNCDIVNLTMMCTSTCFRNFQFEDGSNKKHYTCHLNETNWILLDEAPGSCFLANKMRKNSEK